MIDKEYQDNLMPVDIEFISEYPMDKLGKKLIESDNCNNYSEDAKCCPRCGLHQIKSDGAISLNNDTDVKNVIGHFPKQPILPSKTVAIAKLTGWR